jgi:hypothetical protein
MQLAKSEHNLWYGLDSCRTGSDIPQCPDCKRHDRRHIFSKSLRTEIGILHGNSSEPIRRSATKGSRHYFARTSGIINIGKVVVVSTFNLECSNEAGQKITVLKGYATNLVDKVEEGQRIEWEAKPPDPVKFMRNFEN